MRKYLTALQRRCLARYSLGPIVSRIAGVVTLHCTGREDTVGVGNMAAHNAESARGIAPRAPYRCGLESLDSSGSCHRVAPFLDQPHDGSVRYPVIDEPDKPFVRKAIGNAANVNIEHPVHFLPQQSGVELPVHYAFFAPAEPIRSSRPAE